MRVKVISRSTHEFTRERSQDLQRVFRNFDPNLRPQEKAVEYVRALNAAKLEKMFAYGIWLPVRQFPGHQGAVRGLTVSTNGRILVSCGTDCTLRLWKVPGDTLMESDDGSGNSSQNAFWGVDHQWDGDFLLLLVLKLTFGTITGLSRLIVLNGGMTQLLLFGLIQENLIFWQHQQGNQSLVLLHIFIYLYVILLFFKTKTNSIAWNPMEPMNFTAANDDGKCYSYDVRKLNEAKCVHKDHVSSVMDIDYSPTGREFVTGSYDRTVRIFQYNGGHSREIYHTKRMQRVFCVTFSCDASYIISGSDDTNLRLWKAKASEQLGVVLPRERKKHEYLESVKNSYKHLAEVKRIVRHRHLPKPIYKATKQIREMTESERRRAERRKAHSAAGSIQNEPLRTSRIIKEIE